MIDVSIHVSKKDFKKIACIAMNQLNMPIEIKNETLRYALNFFPHAKQEMKFKSGE